MTPNRPRKPPSSPSTNPRLLSQTQKTLGKIANSAVDSADKVASTRTPDTLVETGSSTLDALQRYGKSRLLGRWGMMRAGFLFRIFRYIPYSVLMVAPFIREDMKRLIRTWKRRKSGQTPLPETAAPTPESEAEARLKAAMQEQRSPYPRYRCPEHPLTCSQIRQAPTAEGDVSRCQQCGFPGLLPENSELRGRRGRYRVERFLGGRGLGRLYAAQDVNLRQPVVIKEYLLPGQHFNPNEQRLTRNTFETIAGLKLADGREQDFRLMEPWDSMGDLHNPDRCYLITRGPVDTYSTLRSSLSQQGPLTPRQVREVLNQALQTLESLHGQKYMLPAGQIQNGLIHGNLNLDSIVMLPDADSYYEQPQLLVFLRDLAVWESLFIPPPAPINIPQVKDDLVALGQVGFYLLVGRWTDAYGRRLKPRSPKVWPKKDPPLEQYLRQLLTFEEPTFESAAEARRALLNLPFPPEHIPTPSIAAAAVEPTRTRRFPIWVWLLLLGLLGLLGAGLLGWWLSRRQAIASQPPALCCVAEVPAAPPGQFTYTAERRGTWDPLWNIKNLVIQGKTLEQVLEEQQPDLDLQLILTPTGQAAIDQVLQDMADFAVVALPGDRPTDLTLAPIAYDGLAVFVAFSYIERDQGLPQHLQGQISLEQLRQLYTGDIRNWRQLGGPDLPVKPYLPTQPELIRVFEQRVLQTPAVIQRFRRQWGLETQQTAANPASFPPSPEPAAINGTPPTSVKILQDILHDFESNPKIGSIGFASLSQIYSQCSIYPLAIAADDEPAVQALYREDSGPISPAVDLCGDKGNYRPKQSLFANQTYPLAYPIVVLYRRDNSRLSIAPTFVQMMTTDEGQQMLSKTGLVPLRDRQTQAE
ncbi:MAG: hypothetical protein MJA27_34555 [Pseudanabaenales cyanobacterium]|nr:hypothetical protein [Pseudanabaenales cyanobacterium]